MQLGNILFVQLPALFSGNLTASVPSSPNASVSVANTTITMTTYSLPPLPYANDALEPHISGQIMMLHHDKHHQAYVTNLNAAVKSQQQAQANGDIKAQIALQQASKFHGGGHINHSLFWPSLCPASSSSASPDAAPELTAAICKNFGSMDAFKAELKALLLGIQGSGWGWLVKTQKGGLILETTRDQDPVTKGEVVMGVDMWEHAYYLQYWNDKAAYVEGVWKVLNWEVAEKRWKGEKVGSVTIGA
ncbi:manganese superoxide dismutase [Geopyxis carbonaria]|nr:manganese superoxide dismutase [Geopyxis carbonaria]